MIRISIRERVLLVAMAAMLSLTGLGLRLAAQESGDSAIAASKGQAPALPGYIAQIEMRVVGSEELVVPVARPLYSYSDSARRIAEGGIWAWGGTGRPVAMAKAWKNPNDYRTVAFTLTSDERVVVLGPQLKMWRPEETQVAAAELAGAPAPDGQEVVRLRQLKEQARRFTAHEFWEPDNSRFELRLLIQPVHRYHDERRQIIDGAVFVLAYDNNPQILLFLEMLSSPAGGARWQYLLARVSSAELHMLLDEKEVWKQDRTPGIVGKPTDYYWHMVTLPEARSTH